MHRIQRAPRSWLSPRSFIAILAALTLLVVASPAAADGPHSDHDRAPPATPDLTEAERDKIHNGEVLVDVDQSDDINQGHIVGIVQNSIDEVTPLIARCWEYGDWREYVEDTRFERKYDDNNVVCSGTAKVPFPFSDREGSFDVYNRSEDVDGTRAFVSTFEYIPDTGNLEEMFGYWVVYPYGENDEHTLIKHQLNIDIGSWIPSRLIRWATGRTLPGTVTGIRKHLRDDVSAGDEDLYWVDYDYE